MWVPIFDPARHAAFQPRSGTQPNLPYVLSRSIMPQPASDLSPVRRARTACEPVLGHDPPSSHAVPLPTSESSSRRISGVPPVPASRRHLVSQAATSESPVNRCHPFPLRLALQPRSATGAALEPATRLCHAPTPGRREHIPASTGHIRPETGRIPPKSGHIPPETGHIRQKSGHVGSDGGDTCLADRSVSPRRSRVRR